MDKMLLHAFMAAVWLFWAAPALAADTPQTPLHSQYKVAGVATTKASFRNAVLDQLGLVSLVPESVALEEVLLAGIITQSYGVEGRLRNSDVWEELAAARDFSGALAGRLQTWLGAPASAPAPKTMADILRAVEASQATGLNLSDPSFWTLYQPLSDCLRTGATACETEANTFVSTAIDLTSESKHPQPNADTPFGNNGTQKQNPSTSGSQTASTSGTTIPVANPRPEKPEDTHRTNSNTTNQSKPADPPKGPEPPKNPEPQADPAVHHDRPPEFEPECPPTGCTNPVAGERRE